MLARIPDLTTEASPPDAQSPRPPAARAPSRGIEYRFDPPQPPVQRERQHEPLASAAAEVDAAGGADPAPTPPAHHWFRRSSSSPAARRAARRRPSLLPKSRPFSLSGAELEDRLAPVIRALVVATLFGIAGLSVLLIYRLGPEPESKPDPAHEATTTQPALHAPTTNGPLTAVNGNPSGQANGQPRTAEQAAGPSQLVGKPDKTNSEAIARPVLDTSTFPFDPPPLKDPTPEMSYPTTGYPAVAFDELSTSAADAVQAREPSAAVELPRIRTDDGVPATARLSGQIYEIPTRQAQHDNHESSIH